MRRLRRPHGTRAAVAIAVVVLAAALGPGAHVAKAEDSVQAARKAVKPENAPLALSEKEQHAIVQAVAQEGTTDTLPEGFQPQVGAKVPPQAKLPLHPLPQPLVRQIPNLKEFEYGKLDRTVLIVDPISKTVVAAIPR